MNATHPSNLVPSPMGDAVGHWEGDTLVIDTVGIKTNAFSAADMYGTPQSAAMHVIERYRLIDGALAKASQDNYEKVQGVVAGRANPDTRAKGLQRWRTLTSLRRRSPSWSPIGACSHHGRNRSAPRTQSNVMKASGSDCRERTIRISKLGLDVAQGIDTTTASVVTSAVRRI
jgi:hypothetical protein